MKKSDFLDELMEIMQRDEPLDPSDELDSLGEWDSMTVLGVISMFDLEFGITLTIDQLKAAKTIQDLIHNQFHYKY